MIVTCPHCHRKNRLPGERLTEHSRCGHCKQALFIAKPIPLSNDCFDSHLQADLPLLVDFWAPWCGPCRQFAPVFEQAAQALEPRLRLAKLNTEAESTLAQRFGIRSIPTLILFRQGRELDRLSGAVSGQALMRWVAQQLNA